MHRWVFYLLKTDHFQEGSRERLKATLLSLVMLLATLVMISDVYESIRLGYGMMSILEGGSATLLMLIYLLFPRYLSLKVSSYSVIGIIGLLFILSLTIDGANPQLALFWLATLPIHLFFFFGIQEGIRFTLLVLSLLFLTFLNTWYHWYPPLYSPSLMFQLFVGYMAISYLLYTLEGERQGYEESLVKAVTQKEVLLKEVHHRTKNNMQVMMALLETQSFKIKNPKYKQMFQAHVNRLKAMALVHAYLYRGEHYERVAIDEYLEEILKHLQPLTRHKISQKVSSSIFDMKVAMNIGLIYNEALHNAMEHAYAPEEIGLIEVSLVEREGVYCLTIQDEGRGFDVTQYYATLGLTLMEDITTSLPCGHLDIQVTKGTQVRVRFQLEERC